MMKKMLAVLLALLLLGLTACGAQEENRDGAIPQNSSSDTVSTLPAGDDVPPLAQDTLKYTPLPNDMRNPDYWETVQFLEWDGAIGGIGCIGYVEGPVGDGYDDFFWESGYMESYAFLPDIPTERYVETDGGEIYLIVPADMNSTVTVTTQTMAEDGSELVQGEVIYSGGGEPVLLRCNESDIFPNTVVTITAPDGSSYSCSPFISRMDGHLEGLWNEESETWFADLSFYNEPDHLEGLLYFEEMLGGWETVITTDDGYEYLLHIEFFYDEDDLPAMGYWNGPVNSEIDEWYEGRVYYMSSEGEEGEWNGCYRMPLELRGGLAYDEGVRSEMEFTYKFQMIDGELAAIHAESGAPLVPGYEYQVLYFSPAAVG